MKTENTELMRGAREALSGKWGLAIGTFVAYLLIVAAISFIPKVGGLAAIAVAGPFAVGLAKFSLSIARNMDAETGQIFHGFNKWGLAFRTYLLVGALEILWLLLLIIPGIIAAISYSMTFFILAEEENIGAMEAIDRSKRIMNGYKLKYFRLMLRFLGLSLLCILTLGIGFLWLIPYMQVTLAKFYEDVKANAALLP